MRSDFSTRGAPNSPSAQRKSSCARFRRSRQRPGTAEQKTLRALAAERPQSFELRDGLDALRHRAHAKAAREIDDRAQRVDRLRTRAEFRHEAPVDLQRVDR